MRTALFQNGADELTFLCLGAAEHSVESHHTACTNKLKPGDILRVDVGGSFDGYYSDLARTAVVGKPSPSQAKAYKALWDVMEKVIEAVRPGIPSKHLYKIYKDRFEELGPGVRMPHVGHCLGIKLHEQPMLTPFKERLLEPNMVLMIEPHRGWQAVPQ
jgi:Xaa-Pro aminopeptidase